MLNAVFEVARVSVSLALMSVCNVRQTYLGTPVCVWHVILLWLFDQGSTSTARYVSWCYVQYS
jgi:hypothetical protein